MVGLTSSWLTYFMQGLSEGEFSRYIDPEPGEPSLWISEGLHSLNHRRFILIFTFYWSTVHVYSTIFSLLVM
jgi:hypothetical protein